MPLAIEMSAPPQAAMSNNDRIHAENIRQYEAQMVEYNASCFRKTAHGLGLAACVVGGVDMVIGLPVLMTKASGLVTGLVGGVGSLVCCLLAPLALQMADEPHEPTHPDHEGTHVVDYSTSG